MTSMTEGIAPDVSALFRRLGAAEAAASYKEFDPKSEAERAMARWPLLGRLVRLKAVPAEVAASVAPPTRPAPSSTEPASEPAIAPAAADTPLKALFRQIGSVTPAAPLAPAAASSREAPAGLEDFTHRTERL